MKYLALVLVSCSVAALAVTPARAFDIQGQSASLQDGSNQFASPTDRFFNPDFDPKGSSLALPYNSKADTYSDFVSDYGNAIAIPAPGVDRPTPAWAFR